MGGVIHVDAVAVHALSPDQAETAVGDLRGNAVAATYRDRFDNGLASSSRLGIATARASTTKRLRRKPLISGTGTVNVSGAASHQHARRCKPRHVIGTRARAPTSRPNAELKLSKDFWRGRHTHRRLVTQATAWATMLRARF